MVKTSFFGSKRPKIRKIAQKWRKIDEKIIKKIRKKSDKNPISFDFRKIKSEKNPKKIRYLLILEK